MDERTDAVRTSPWLTYRRVFIVLVHIALWVLAMLVAYLLRFEFQPPARFLRIAAETLPVLVGLRLICFWQQRLFHGMWRYTGSKDLGGIIIATTAATLFFVLYCTLAGYARCPAIDLCHRVVARAAHRRRQPIWYPQVARVVVASAGEW